MQARFDLLTSFRQGNHSLDEWYYAMQARVNFHQIPPGNSQNTPQGHLLVFFLKDDDFVSRPSVMGV